jgi:hypothetical protein
MAGVSVDTRSIVLVALVVFAVLGGAYALNPHYVKSLLGMREGFDGAMPATLNVAANYKANMAAMDAAGAQQAAQVKANPNVAAFRNMDDEETDEGFADNKKAKENFADLGEGPSAFGNADAPAGCYPRDQLVPSELLPKDPNSVWAQQNPMGTGSLKGKNFLSAGALIGVNTVGQSLRNANYSLRSEPPNPQVAVSVFNQTTIEPDVNRRTLEIS